ncbi:hypothetical protein PTKIN_Ptkin08bG0182300 [Pterospermum kingtungense]
MEETKQIDGHFIKSGFGSEVYATNSLLHVYATSGSIESARLLFDKVLERDIVSWNSMIDGYTSVIQGVKPNNVALASTLSACSYLGALDQGRWIHAYIDRLGLEIDPILGCVPVDMYAKCGDMEEAIEVFKKVKKIQVSLWTALISGFVIHGRGREALDWFENMQMVGESIQTMSLLLQF